MEKMLSEIPSGCACFIANRNCAPCGSTTMRRVTL
jgi:hypothetical protein